MSVRLFCTVCEFTTRQNTFQHLAIIARMTIFIPFSLLLCLPILVQTPHQEIRTFANVYCFKSNRRSIYRNEIKRTQNVQLYNVMYLVLLTTFNPNSERIIKNVSNGVQRIQRSLQAVPHVLRLFLLNSIETS